jgi:hypothetical protein
LIDYIKQNPRGLQKSLKNPKESLESIVETAERLMGKQASSTGSKRAKYTNDQVEKQVLALQQTPYAQLSPTEKVMRHVVGNDDYATLDLHYQRLIKYFLEVPSTAKDYANALIQANIPLKNARKLLDILTPFGSHQRVFESQLRKFIRELVVGRMGNSATGYDQLMTLTQRMNTTNRGQFFETWGKANLPLPSGAKSLGSKSIVINKKNYTPDEIIQLADGTLMFREYKHFDARTKLDGYDSRKISDYNRAINSNKKLIQLDGKTYQLSETEYIFSNKGASDNNFEMLDNSIKNKYIQNGKIQENNQ